MPAGKPKAKRKLISELTPEERERKRKYQRDYNKLPHMREYRRKYDASPNGKKRSAKWRYSAHGKAYKSRYDRLPKTRDTARKRLRALREQTLIAYSKDGMPKCACCGEDNIGFLTLDHADNNGSEHRRRLSAGKGGSQFYRKLRDAGWPNDPPLQVLCYNCNCGKQNNAGICPHKGRADLNKSLMPQPARIAVEPDECPLFDRVES